MENIRRKNNMIETYSILLIDMVCVSVSYYLSLFIRFDCTGSVPQRLSFHGRSVYFDFMLDVYTFFGW